MPLPPPIAVHLTTLPSHNCNYLPGRVATARAFRVNRLPGELYHQFMDAGFRRSGTIIYQQDCGECQKCMPIRVPVDRFKPNKSQRRCIRQNGDLEISHGEPELTDEKFDLYRKYISDWHGRTSGQDADRESCEQFLYRSPVQTIEFCYRTPDKKLMGVGISDLCDQSLSSVYFYFDPQENHRGLGTFSALHEIDLCRRFKIPHYYLGFWINGCNKMQYKSCFRPAEILSSAGIWHDLFEEGGSIL